MLTSTRRAHFREWAKERKLEAPVHDDAYAGTINGLPITIDTGVRDSGSYDVVLRIAVACGIPNMLIKKDSPRDDTHRVVSALYELVTETADMKSAFIDQDAVELRFKTNVHLDVIDEAIEAITSAWHNIDGRRGAYR